MIIWKNSKISIQKHNKNQLARTQRKPSIETRMNTLQSFTYLIHWKDAFDSIFSLLYWFDFRLKRHFLDLVHAIKYKSLNAKPFLCVTKRLWIHLLIFACLHCTLKFQFFLVLSSLRYFFPFRTKRVGLKVNYLHYSHHYLLDFHGNFLLHKCLISWTRRFSIRLFALCECVHKSIWLMTKFIDLHTWYTKYLKGNKN